MQDFFYDSIFWKSEIKAKGQSKGSDWRYRAIWYYFSLLVVEKRF